MNYCQSNDCIVSFEVLERILILGVDWSAKGVES